MHRGYRFKLYPTAAQAETLGQWVGATRFVYNLALEQRRDFWRQFLAAKGRHMGLSSQAQELTALRASTDWIAAVPQTVLEAAINDLDRAYKAFFKGGGYPSPRRLGVNDSIRFRGREAVIVNLNAKWSALKVPKMGWLRFRRSREICGRILTATLVRKAVGWTVTFAAEIDGDPPISDLPAVGIDRGVATTLSLSTGEHVRLPNTAALDRKRRKAQRVLARRKRGSRRYAKQRRLVARIASKLARVRTHHLHIASTDIVRRFGFVAIERLNVRSMTASAAGTMESPGKNVAQKRGLNRSILAQGWAMFADMLDYKLEAAGGRLAYVPAPYTSQTCAQCGVVDARNRKSQSVFSCVSCGHIAHADTNAAVNILRGSTALVEGGHSGRPCEARTLAACPPKPASAGDAEPPVAGFMIASSAVMAT